MPCTYTSMEIREKEAARQKQLEREREEERKRREIEKKRRTLIAALVEMGFGDIDEQELEGGNLLIVGGKK